MATFFVIFEEEKTSGIIRLQAKHEKQLVENSQ